MSSTYKTVKLAKRPRSNIVLGETFSINSGNPTPSAADLKDGEVLFETNYISIDPGMRGWLSDSRSYTKPVAIGETMRGFAVGTIQASKHSKFAIGSHATGLTGWTELKVCKGDELQAFEVPTRGNLVDALSVLGMTSLTAYFGMIDIGKVKAGDVVVVSGAAGATGSVAGQIAKLKGATVIGIAGSEEKCRWLKEEIGFDDALNYKDPDFVAKFTSATPNLIDLFYDNVGGDILDLALSRANPFSRFVMCGGLSQYNTENPQGPKNYMNIVLMRIRMQGFLVFDYITQYPQALKELTQWVSEGKIKSAETIVTGGLDQAEKALHDVFSGVNKGKLLVEVKAP